MNKLLTIKDIQEIFGCGKDKAYRIMKNESFPSIKIGKTRYITEDALNEWLKDYSFSEFKL